MMESTSALQFFVRENLTICSTRSYNFKLDSSLLSPKRDVGNSDGSVFYHPSTLDDVIWEADQNLIRVSS